METLLGILGVLFCITILFSVFPLLGHIFDVVLGLAAMGGVGLVVIILFGEGARWADDIFVQHPAEPIVEAALRKGRKLDTSALRDALTPALEDLDLDRPAYHYQHQTRKARALTEKLREDARLAEAAVRRERARAALQDAERNAPRSKRRRKASVRKA
jgi:hypothetical protein